MTRTRATIVAAVGGLALAASLGAGPATQPARAVAGAPFREGSCVIVPPRVDVMPNASVYLTPRAQWIPRQFNGGTFYLIPCEKTESATAAAIPAPSQTVVTRGAVTVDWGKLLSRPSTQPTSAAAP